MNSGIAESYIFLLKNSYLTSSVHLRKKTRANQARKSAFLSKKNFFSFIFS